MFGPDSSIVVAPGDVLAVNEAATDLLVADDDAGSLVAYDAALASLGRKVVLVKTGMEALARLLDHDFALLVLDMSMPGMTGIETARLVRQRPRHRTMPILFITGLSWPPYVVTEAYELGAVDFAQKPILPEVLRAKVRTHLDLQDQTRAIERARVDLHAASERVREAERQMRAEHQRLISKLGHDLRNPLASMLSVLELIELRDGKVGREHQILQRQVAHLTNIVRAMLPGEAEVTPVVPGKVPVARQGARKILIVDDNRDGADMLVELLRSIGHEVAIAYDGMAGLELAITFAPDVALLDLDLPELDGYELATRMRELTSCAHTELVALTAHGQTTDREHTRRVGFTHHLVKPAELATLAALLAQTARRTP